MLDLQEQDGNAFEYKQTFSSFSRRYVYNEIEMKNTFDIIQWYRIGLHIKKRYVIVERRLASTSQL